MMSPELLSIQEILKQSSSEEGRVAAAKFVPGLGERVYGVRMPTVNQLAGQFKSGGFKLIEELWKSGSLEEKILAAKILDKIARKDPTYSIRLVRYFSKNIGNWAVCDAIGMQALKPIVLTHDKEIFALAKELNKAKDPWQRRLSLVLVEWYTRFTKFHPEIKKLIKSLENDEEYYVKKAIVWINRNLQKGT
jgi:3-methyladenine DNA glycosylase AlkD